MEEGKRGEGKGKRGKGIREKGKGEIGGMGMSSGKCQTNFVEVEWLQRRGKAKVIRGIRGIWGIGGHKGYKGHKGHKR